MNLDTTGFGALRLRPTSSSVILFWRSPKLTVLSYIVRYEEIKTNGEYGNVKTQVAGRRTVALRVSGLTPGKRYEFTVSAKIGNGEAVVSTLQGIV